MNYGLTISYDGTRYHGWESKKEVDTIEGKLEAVFARMTEQDVKIHGAGRTDAGVHAKGMVANGFLDTTLTPEHFTEEKILSYLNHYLPDDICIREVSGVSERFHARLNAKGKVYQYTCYIGDEKPVFERLYTWVLPEWVTNGTPDRMPDIEAMQKAAEYLIGTHDFKSFCGNNKMKKSTVRTIYDITIAEEEGYLRMTFHGNGFLQNMVRILTGTLLEVGKGDYPPEKVKEILAAKDRKMAGATARPEGLTLVQIRYPEWDFE